MSDIDDVKNLAQSKKAKKVNERIQQEKLLKERIQHKEQYLNDLHVRLKDLKKQLKRDVKIIIKKNDSGLDVYLGTSPLLGKPYKHFKFYECDDIEAEIERIKESAADMLAEGYIAGTPEWVYVFYQIIGVILGTLSGIGIWVILGITAGIWGILLGWIPAIIAGKIISMYWPVLILISVLFYYDS